MINPLDIIKSINEAPEAKEKPAKETKPTKTPKEDKPSQYASLFNTEQDDEYDNDDNMDSESQDQGESQEDNTEVVVSDIATNVSTAQFLNSVTEIRAEIEAYGGKCSPVTRWTAESGDDLVSYHAVVPHEAAGHWLEVRNSRNYRRFRPVNLRRLTAAMKEHRYSDGLGDPIKFTRDADLSDGQHRLAAMWSAKQTYSFLIVHGVQHTVKDGKAVPKTLVDTLKLHKIDNSGSVSAVLRALWRFDKNGVYVQSRQESAEDDLLLDMYYRNKERVDHFASICRNRVICMGTPLAAFAFLADRVEPGYGDYVTQLMKGKRVASESDPMRLAVLRFSQPKGAGMRASTSYELAILIKAWNLHRAGRTVKTLRYNPSGPRAEDYPAFDGFTPIDGVRY